MSDFKDDAADVKRPCVNSSASECAQSLGEKRSIQRISSGRATQAQAFKHRSCFPPEQCCLASSACASPAHSAGPLSPTSSATLAAIPFHDSCCLQPSAPRNTSASCTSIDTDHLHQAHCTAVPDGSGVCQGDQPLHASCCTSTEAVCGTAYRWQQQPVHPEPRPGEATSEPRLPQKKRPRVRNRATAVRTPTTPSLGRLYMSRLEHGAQNQSANAHRSSVYLLSECRVHGHILPCCDPVLHDACTTCMSCL